MYKAIIIEDDPIMTKLNSIYLEDRKDILLASSFRDGEKALSYLKKHPADLILLDFHLPGMNGFEFLHRLRLLPSQAMVIMATMDNDELIFNRLQDYGIIDFLLKPYTYSRYKQALDNFISRKESMKSFRLFTQEQADSYLSRSIDISNEDSASREKGIQQETSQRILSYLKQMSDTPLTLTTILNDVPLSRVTLRRYMQYFSDTGIVTTTANYSTGGRPSLVYMYSEEPTPNSQTKI